MADKISEAGVKLSRVSSFGSSTSPPMPVRSDHRAGGRWGSSARPLSEPTERWGARGRARATRHEGEEFILVLKGRIELHTEFYEPARLEAGDGACSDSGMAPMFLNLGEDQAIMASICYSDAIDGPGLIAAIPAGETVEP
jgi:hypothetical protein